MSHAAFTQTLHSEMRPLVESMFGELRANPGTSHYHRLSNDELLRRGQDVYQHLVDWLAGRDLALIQKAGTSLGQLRFAEGIPLGQVVLAILLEEKHLWKYPVTFSRQKASRSGYFVNSFYWQMDANYSSFVTGFIPTEAVCFH